MQHNATKLNQSDWLEAKKNEKQLDLMLTAWPYQTNYMNMYGFFVFFCFLGTEIKRYEVQLEAFNANRLTLPNPIY